MARSLLLSLLNRVRLSVGSLCVQLHAKGDLELDFQSYKCRTFHTGSTLFLSAETKIGVTGPLSLVFIESAFPLTFLPNDGERERSCGRNFTSFLLPYDSEGAVTDGTIRLNLLGWWLLLLLDWVENLILGCCGCSCSQDGGVLGRGETRHVWPVTTRKAVGSGLLLLLPASQQGHGGQHPTASSNNNTS